MGGVSGGGNFEPRHVDGTGVLTTRSTTKSLPTFTLIVGVAIPSCITALWAGSVGGVWKKKEEEEEREEHKSVVHCEWGVDR